MPSTAVRGLAGAFFRSLHNFGFDAAIAAEPPRDLRPAVMTLSSFHRLAEVARHA